MKNNEMMELNMDQMEAINGGWGWDFFNIGGGVGVGGMLGFAVGAGIALLGGPVGVLVVAGTVAGAAAGGVIGAAVTD